MSLSNQASEAISMEPLWRRLFGDWRRFEVPSTAATLARQAAEVWGKLADELAGPPAVEDDEVKTVDPAPTPEQYRFAYFNRANDAMRFAFWPDGAPKPDQEMLDWAQNVIEIWTDLRAKLAGCAGVAAVVTDPEPILDRTAPWKTTLTDDPAQEATSAPGKLDVAALVKPLLDTPKARADRRRAAKEAKKEAA